MKYRILSLDGGGSWALIQVKALIDMYGANTLGNDVLKDFDLVTANSGGSIVLGGLVENMTLSDLLNKFQDVHIRQAMFSPTSKMGDKIIHGLTHFGPKYSSDNKLPALQHEFPQKGDIALADAIQGIKRADRVAADPANAANLPDVHLLIVAFDYDHNRATFFRSARAAHVTGGTGTVIDVTLAEAIHSSTNAPVNYFDGPATFPDREGRYWDGAVTGCNNPVLAGVTEAIIKGQKPEDIVALSIGTASVALPWELPGQPASPYVQKKSDDGLINDVKKLSTSILDDPPDVATFLSHVMTACGTGIAATPKSPIGSRIIRMNPLISPIKDAQGAWTAPGDMTAAQFTYLANLDMDAVAQPEVNAITKLAESWLAGEVSNQPVRMDGATLALEIGQATFADAKAEWNNIR